MFLIVKHWIILAAMIMFLYNKLKLLERGKPKVIDMEKQAISDRALSENINKCYDLFRRTCDHYRKGFIAEDQMKIKFQETIRKGFWEFIQEKRLLNLLKRTDQSGWERFLEDYHLWKNGERPCSNKGTLWLAYSEDFGYEEEASYTDKVQFFKLMEAFHLPIELFHPLKAGTICPDDHPGHYPCEIIIGWYIWQDAGNLLSDDFEPGKIIVLTDHFGLKSRTKITDNMASDEEKTTCHSHTGYIGIGCMEGYTTSRKREIRIDVKDGKICSLSAIMDNDDLDIYKNFPLWKDAHEHYMKGKVLWDEVVSTCIHIFLQGTSN